MGKKGSKLFSEKLLTPRELKYFKIRFMTPEQMRRDVEGQNMANYLAGRWAAKEACVKAVKPRKLTHSDIEIWPGENMETYAIILDETTPGEQTFSANKQSTPDAATQAGKGDDDSHVRVASGPEAPPKTTQTRYLNALDNVPSHDNIKGQIVKLSLSHDTDYACAVALYADPETSNQDSSTEQRLTNIERELLRLRRAQGQRHGNMKE